MELFHTLTPEALTDKAKKLYRQERESHKILNGWFLSKEIAADAGEAMTETHPELRSAGELEAIIAAAVENANEARRTSTGVQPKFVALDIGPSGRMLKPLGDLDFEDAVELFAQTIRIGVKCGRRAGFFRTEGICDKVIERSLLEQLVICRGRDDQTIGIPKSEDVLTEHTVCKEGTGIGIRPELIAIVITAGRFRCSDKR